MERRTFSAGLLASLLPTALWARADENATIVSYETHRGWRVWDCVQQFEIKRVRWANRSSKEFAWLDNPARIDYELANVIENVTCVQGIVFVHHVKLVLIDPCGDPTREANRAIATMTARKGEWIALDSPEKIVAYRAAMA